MRGYLRGNVVEWDTDAGLWRYPDTGEPAEGNPRLCPQCHRLPHEDGRDACLPHIPDATGACCGHGVHTGYVTWIGIPAPSQWWQRAYLIEESSDA